MFARYLRNVPLTLVNDNLFQLSQYKNYFPSINYLVAYQTFNEQRNFLTDCKIINYKNNYEKCPLKNVLLNKPIVIKNISTDANINQTTSEENNIHFFKSIR